MTKIPQYKYEDSKANLWAIIALNFSMVFIMCLPLLNQEPVSWHPAFVAVQTVLFYIWVRWGDLRNTLLLLFVGAVYAATTGYEAIVWMQNLTGVMPSILSPGKGRLFGIIFDSPPYLYPIIRLVTIIMFIPFAVRTFQLEDRVAAE